MEDFIIFIIVLITMAVSATAGRIADPQFRCSMMRRFMKKNYVVVNFGDKNGRVIFQSVVNADDGVVIMGMRLWVVKGGRIYHAVMKDSKIVRDEKGAYTFKESDMKFTPGTPNIFLNPDTLTPLQFYGPEAEVKPDEIGSTLLAWVNTQINKGLNKFANLDLWIKAGVVLCVINLLGLYFVFGGFDQQKKNTDATNAAVDKVNIKLTRLAAALRINVEDTTAPQNTTEQVVDGKLIVNGGG